MRKIVIFKRETLVGTTMSVDLGRQIAVVAGTIKMPKLRMIKLRTKSFMVSFIKNSSVSARLILVIHWCVYCDYWWTLIAQY